MRRREEIVRTLFGRDVAIGYVVLVIMYLVRTIEFSPLQIPAYLLIVGYDVVEVLVPAIAPFHLLGFPLYLYVLAVIGANGTRMVLGADTPGGNWRRGIAGVCLLVGLISITFGIAVGGPIIAPTDNPTPLAITGLTGLAFLLVALLLLARSP